MTGDVDEDDGPTAFDAEDHYYDLHRDADFD